jgi:hypothetical protein
MRVTKSAIVLLGGVPQFIPEFIRIPVISGWVWDSTKPGTIVFPAASMWTRFGIATDSIIESSPIAAIVPLRINIAEALGIFASRVIMLAFVMAKCTLFQSWG